MKGGEARRKKGPTAVSTPKRSVVLDNEAVLMFSENTPQKSSPSQQHASIEGRHSPAFRIDTGSSTAVSDNMFTHTSDLQTVGFASGRETIREKIVRELKAELKSELMEGLKQEIKAELKQELKEELLRELKGEGWDQGPEVGWGDQENIEVRISFFLFIEFYLNFFRL